MRWSLLRTQHSFGYPGAKTTLAAVYTRSRQKGATRVAQQAAGHQGLQTTDSQSPGGHKGRLMNSTFMGGNALYTPCVQSPRDYISEAAMAGSKRSWDAASRQWTRTAGDPAPLQRSRGRRHKAHEDGTKWRWTPKQRKALARRARMCGISWEEVVNCTVLRNRTPAAAQQEWKRMRAAVDGDHLSGSIPAQRREVENEFVHEVASHRTAEQSQQSEVEAATKEAVADYHAWERRARLGSAEDVEFEKLSLATPVRQDAKHHSTSFQHVFRKRKSNTRRWRQQRKQPGEGTVAHTLARNWELHRCKPGHSVLLVNFHRAKAIAINHLSPGRNARTKAQQAAAEEALRSWRPSIEVRDALGLVHYPDTTGEEPPLNTLLGGSA